MLRRLKLSLLTAHQVMNLQIKESGPVLTRKNYLFPVLSHYLEFKFPLNISSNILALLMREIYQMVQRTRLTRYPRCRIFSSINNVESDHIFCDPSHPHERLPKCTKCCSHPSADSLQCLIRTRKDDTFQNKAHKIQINGRIFQSPSLRLATLISRHHLAAS